MSAAWDNVVAVVLGGANTDLVATGVAGPAKPGEMLGGQGFTVGPGGKSRNVAHMMGVYLGPGRVSFVGRTLAAPAFAELDRLLDPTSGDAAADILPHVHGLLAQVPLAALRRAGVLTDMVTQVRGEGITGGTALIVVLSSGENMIYSIPGVNADFSAEDVARAEPLVEAVARRGGVMPLALEIPADTALAGARLARRHGLKVILDAGGMTKAETLNRRCRATLDDVLAEADVVKPNEHEARLLTEIEVTDGDSAARAAEALHRRYGTADVVVTAGTQGAWHWSEQGLQFHPAYRPPQVLDTTGCGDQFMAVLSAHLACGDPWPEAMQRAAVAGALQATRVGIQPVAREEVDQHLPRYREQAEA